MLRNARARNTHVEATLNHSCAAQAFVDLPPVMYRHWIARGPRLPEDFWWRLLGATADWIFMARAARVYNIKGTGARSDQTPSSFSRTAGLRGNASLFSLFREAAGDGALPTTCQWTRRDFY